MKNTQRTFCPPGVILLISLLLLIFFGGGNLYAQQAFWEGRITTAPYGLLPNSGLYAASNAFPMDTKVVITHPANGSTLEVRVVERLDQERVFMQLSTEAAETLGLKKNEILTVKVSPVASSGGLVEEQIASEAPFSSDPDVNPAAGVEGERLSLIEEYLASADAEADSAAEETIDGISEGVAEAEAVNETVVEGADEGVAETPAEVPSTEPVLRYVDSIPEKTVPEEDISVALPPPLRPEDFETEEASETADLVGTPEEEAEEVPAEKAVAEISTAPTVVSIEPLFLREKDRSYSPSAPLPPVMAREEGVPHVSMRRVEAASSGTKDEYTVRHSPKPPKREGPSPDLRIAEADERPAGSIEPLHSPEALKPGEEKSEEKVAAEEPPEEERPEDTAPKIVDTGPETPEEIPEDAELVLIPAEERPPVGPPTVEENLAEEETAEKPAASPEVPAVVESTPRESEAEADITPVRTGTLLIRENLEKSSYYLQVAAYNKLELARARGEGLASRYPVTIYSDRGAAAAPYKLMIGPLNEDESGTLLFTFNSLGYPDAFIRRGN